jgi:thiamine-phosphate pyrophosphorylase
VVFRHFGAADKRIVARRLQRFCVRRRLTLLIGADPALATMIGAAGVHLPERMAADAAALKAARPEWIVSVASHSALPPIARADAFILSPVYPSRSMSAGKPLGLATAARIARASITPMIALGGIKPAHMRELANAGFAGVAGIDLFVG